MQAAIDKDGGAQFVVPPTFTSVGLNQELLERCVAREGLVVFASPSNAISERVMASVVRYALEGDTFIKGNFTYIGDTAFDFSTVSSSHSIVMHRSAESLGDSYLDKNNSVMRRSSDLVVFNGSTCADMVENMVQAGLTGQTAFGAVEASDIPEVFDAVCQKYPVDERSLKIWDFIESTSMILCQRTVQDMQGGTMVVWSHLALSKEVKLVLFDALNTTAGVDAVSDRVRGIVEEGQFGSSSFKSQGKHLLKQGLIDNGAFEELLRVGA